MKNRIGTKKLNLDSFIKFQVSNLKSIFGGIENDDIEKKKVRRPGMTAG